MRTFLIVVLPIVSFAAGAVSARRWRRQSLALAHPLEVIVLVAGLIAIAKSRPVTSDPRYALFCVASMFVAAAITSLITSAPPATMAGTREFEHGELAQAPTSLWKRYIGFTRAMGDYEFRLLLTATYLLIVPFAMLAKAASRTSIDRSRTNWLERAPEEAAKAIE